MIRKNTTSAVTVFALVGLCVGAAPAVADDSAPTPETVAAVIDQVAPEEGAVVHGTIRDGQIATDLEGVESRVPLDPAAPIEFDADLGVESVSATISLPAELTMGEAQIATDGTVVYDADQRASAAVQVLEDGSTRLQTVTHDASGPHRFSYTVGGQVTPTLTDGGQVLLVVPVPGEDDAVMIAAVLDAPWAVDSSGREVTTSYEIEGNTVVQVIDADPQVQYPLVADPKLDWGFFSQAGDYVHVTNGEASAHGWWNRIGTKLPGVCCTSR